MGSAPWGSPSSKLMELASRGSPSPQRIGFASHLYTAMEFASRESHSRQRLHLTSRGIPFPKRMWFIARGSPSPSEWDSHQEGHPLHSEWDSLLTPGLVAADPPFKGFFSKATLLKDSLSPKGFASVPKRMVFASRDSHSPKQQRFESRDSDSPRRRLHSELRLVRLQLRDPIRGFLPPILIHLYDKIRKLKMPLFQAQLRPWWILEFLRNKVPDFHFLPISIKRALLIRGHSGHDLRLTTLSPIWWWLSFVLFMKRTSAYGQSSYLLVAEVPLQELLKCGFCLIFQCFLRHPEEGTTCLWSLLALRLMTCPYLSHILNLLVDDSISSFTMF